MPHDDMGSVALFSCQRVAAFDDSDRHALSSLPVVAAGGPEGLEFLSSRAPWKCNICNVACTSQDTLMGHAAGAKHKRRVSESGGGAGRQPRGRE